MSQAHTDARPFADYLTKQQFCAAVPGGPISERTADRWHTQRTGPKRLKVGRTVVYHRRDVEKWLAAQADRGIGGQK